MKPETKADGLRAMREANYAANHSDGAGESRPGLDSKVAEKRHRERLPVEPVKLRASLSDQDHGRESGVATGPSEAKRKRGPRGSFDRVAYQKQYMRERRASGKVDKHDRKKA